MLGETMHLQSDEIRDLTGDGQVLLAGDVPSVWLGIPLKVMIGVQFPSGVFSRFLFSFSCFTKKEHLAWVFTAPLCRCPEEVKRMYWGTEYPNLQKITNKTNQGYENDN